MIRFLRRRWTIRTRLTVLYGGLFFLAGGLVVLVTYVLMRRSLATDPLPYPIAIPGTAGASKHDIDAKVAAGISAVRAYRDATLAALLREGLSALAIVGVGAVGLGWLVAGRVLRPLHRVTATAQRVAERNLHERIRLSGPHDEVRELADTFDSMLDRLGRAFESQRTFVGNASHELKTPLTINRTLIEVAMARPDAPPALRHLGETLLAVNARHERLIDGLLTLASAEHEPVGVESVDLAELGRVALDQIPTAHLDVRSSLAPAWVTGSPILLEGLVRNLVQNAVRHNRREQGLLVIESGEIAGSEVTLRVENTGPKIAEHEISALFEPFRRLGSERTGSTEGAGLGLSIVRSVARVHRGEVTAVPRTGGGLVVTVRLPAASPR